MLQGEVYVVDNDGLTIEGKGSKGRPFRIFLFQSDSPYSITVQDSTDDTIILQGEPKMERILYYRLKESYRLTIFNKVQGRVRFL